MYGFRVKDLDFDGGSLSIRDGFRKQNIKYFKLITIVRYVEFARLSINFLFFLPLVIK
jgi:hypothetical protein